MSQPSAKSAAKTIDYKEETGKVPLSKTELIKMADLMIKSRVLEERLIKMNKAGQGYFWLGGPGEEAFNVPLGLLYKKGEGLDYDYGHFHYRQSATLLAMGVPMIDPIRQMHAVATDPYSGGRTFISHYSIRKWNVGYISSPIEVQYSFAIGTGVAQARHGGDGITIVTGGDAGTAEGHFASCLVWSSAKCRPLPILIIVTNNNWGISTYCDDVRCDLPIAARGAGFGIKNKTINGNNLIESYTELKKAMDYVRKERKPFLLEVKLSRLHGHSSASGANRVQNEADCLVEIETYLKKHDILEERELNRIREKYQDEAKEALAKVLQEPKPEGSTIFDYIYANKEEATEPWPRWLKR